MAERPEDAFERCRVILARARRLGTPFEVIWPRALEASVPAIEADRKTLAMKDADAARNALLTNEETWRAAYERRELPSRPKPPLPRQTIPH
jgi:hypothetical protein